MNDNHVQTQNKLQKKTGIGCVLQISAVWFSRMQPDSRSYFQIQCGGSVRADAKPASHREVREGSSVSIHMIVGPLTPKSVHGRCLMVSGKVDSET